MTFLVINDTERAAAHQAALAARLEDIARATRDSGYALLTKPQAAILLDVPETAGHDLSWLHTHPALV